MKHLKLRCCYKFFIVIMLMVLGSNENRVFAFTPRLEAPQLRGVYYLDDNPYPAKGQNGTWYAFGRAYEILGYRPKIKNGDAKDWWNNNIQSGAYSYGSTPVVGAIACWNYGRYGKVAIVEKINNGKILISESCYDPPITFRTIEIDPYSIPGFQGYIYLLENIQNGKYIITGRENNMVIQTDKYNENNGANVSLGKYNGGDNQKWMFVSNGDGSYRILSKQTKKALDVEGIKKESGANIHTWDYVGGANQKWDIISCGNGWYQLVANHSDCRLDVAGNWFKEGTNIQQCRNNGSSAQKFKLTRTEENYVKFKTDKTDVVVPSFEKIFKTQPVSSVYNAELSLLSSCLCEASNSFSGNKIVETYIELGFSDSNIRLHSYPEHPNNRSNIHIFNDKHLAFSIAHKYIENNALIVIVLRGTQMESVDEVWKDVSGSFSSGKEFGNKRAYDGFYDFYSDVKYGLELYFNEHVELKNISPSNLKILITGHSLGGAGANLMGTYLTYGASGYDKDNIFVYTFASPNVYRLSDDFAPHFYIGSCDNIFNIINSNDNVPYYPLTLHRFGKDYTFTNGKADLIPVNSNHYIENYVDYIYKFPNKIQLKK